MNSALLAAPHALAGARTRIVATIGPASRSEASIEALLCAGVDAARFNFSHGSHAEHAEGIALVRSVAERLGRSVAVIQDLQGPKLRTGETVGGLPVMLTPGAEVMLSSEPSPVTAQRVSIPHPELFDQLRVGDLVLLDDGRLRLRVVTPGTQEVRAAVEVGGLLADRKGVATPGVSPPTPSLTDKDKEDLRFGVQQGVDWVALSFVRRARDLREARRWLAEGGASVPLIAKIEQSEAVDNLEAILNESDAVMLARGDLGVEVGPEQVPVLQKRVIRAANRAGVPIITATQMLESMISSPTPTRAEATDVATAVWDATDAVMLSGETAIGRYPVETVTTMNRLLLAAEAAELPRPPAQPSSTSRAQAVSRAARVLASDLDAAAIVAFTRTGRTAQLLSKQRPTVPVLAFTPDRLVARRLSLWWGVVALECAEASNTEELIQAMGEGLLVQGVLPAGSRVVVVGSMPFRKGSHTNFLKVHTLRRRTT